MKALSYLLAGLIVIFATLGIAERAQSVEPGASEPIGEEGIQGVPVLFFGAICDKAQVFWILLDNGHFIRFDKDHRPKNMTQFRRQLGTLKSDTVDLCPSTGL
jgi:hypothetical protein